MYSGGILLVPFLRVSKYARLDDGQLNLLRDCLQRCGHPRFRKEFAQSRHVPYGNSAEFKKSIATADVSKLAMLVRIVGLLLQTKVYLFWTKI